MQLKVHLITTIIDRDGNDTREEVALSLEDGYLELKSLDTTLELDEGDTLRLDVAELLKAIALLQSGNRQLTGEPPDEPHDA
jgi:hypothetical protein